MVCMRVKDFCICYKGVDVVMVWEENVILISWVISKDNDVRDVSIVMVGCLFIVIVVNC